MKRLLAVLSSYISIVLFADASIIGITAQQQSPWNGLVNIVVSMAGTSNEVANCQCVFAATNHATGIRVPITSVTRNGADVGSGTTWIRKFIWNAANDVGVIKIDDLVLTVEANEQGGVQLWENGPYWAERNVGADKPEEYGYYFWWGDTVGYKRNATNKEWISVKDSAPYVFSQGACPTMVKSNAELKSLGYIDATGILVAAHDAATVHQGAPWRMPTQAEIIALTNYCTICSFTTNGVKGQLVTGKGVYASKSFFLPNSGCGFNSGICDRTRTGYSWSSTPSSPNYTSYAWTLKFTFGYFKLGLSQRHTGLPVRPVRGLSQKSGATTHVALDYPIPTIPDSATQADIVKALEGSADAGLTNHITTVANYNAYRTWAQTVTLPGGESADLKTVKDSQHGWLSFALDSPMLLTKKPEQGEMMIASFTKNDTTGKFDFAVGIAGLSVGTGARAENLAAVFELGGATSIHDDFSADNVVFTFGTPVDGKVVISALPKDETATQFFLKVKMTP